MNIDFHMKKFFEDEYNDPNMYFDYINGKIILNYELYDKWYKAMKKRSASFYDLANHSNLTPDIELFETTTTSDFAVTKFLGHKRIELKEFMMPKIEERPLGGESFHYICNGCYETTLENIYKVLNKGSFTVGICCEKKTEEFRNIVKYYNELKHFLMMKGYSLFSYESNVSGNNRVYLLNYDSRKNKSKK